MMTWQFEEWRELPYCDKHDVEVSRESTKRRLEDFRKPFPRMFFWDLSTFPADDAAGAAAKAAAIEWHEDLEGNLFIHGPVGGGKTGLAWSIALLQVEGNPFDEIRFVNVRQLLTSVRRSFGNPDAHDPTDELLEPWCLVLDDLGAERVTDWTREWLATLIEGRYVAEFPTIVTSNYSPSQLAKRLGHDDPVVGKRIVSRLIEGATIIKLDRADLRLRDAA